VAKSKREKQETALVKLVVSIGDDLAQGRSTPLAKRQEYNRLKTALGYTDYIRPGVWLI
jgi:hypothetical protein